MDDAAAVRYRCTGDGDSEQDLRRRGSAYRHAGANTRDLSHYGSKRFHMSLLLFP